MNWRIAKDRLRIDYYDCYQVDFLESTRRILISPKNEISFLKQSYVSSALLEIQESRGNFFIEKHRNEELTHQYYGQQVSISWIEKFMNHHKGLVEKKSHAIDMEMNALRQWGRRVDPGAWRKEKKIILPLKSEPEKEVYNLCKLCSGDGGIRGGCPKCGGSGWS